MRKNKNIESNFKLGISHIKKKKKKKERNTKHITKLATMNKSQLISKKTTGLANHEMQVTE